MLDSSVIHHYMHALHSLYNVIMSPAEGLHFSGLVFYNFGRCLLATVCNNPVTKQAYSFDVLITA